MSLVVIGLNHRTAPLEVLERMAVTDASTVAKSLAGLSAQPNLNETVVLSTCNRTEVYVDAERFHEGYAEVREVMCQLSHLDPEQIVDHLYVHHDTSAVRHLFEVTAGLDSAVLGEHEIQGQVARAWEVARDEGTSHAVLNLVFRHAVEAGKRARTETAIGAGTASVSHAAVAMAVERLGSLTGRRVVIVGAGDMGETLAGALGGAELADLAVVNRTPARAADLAERLGGRATPLAALEAELAQADLVLTSTAATEPVVTADHVAPRPDRPLLIIDIAVPRDVDGSVGRVEGVELLDMDDVRTYAQTGIENRSAEVAAVRSILDEEVARYQTAATAREVAPVVVALRTRADVIRQREIDRHRSRLARLETDELEVVEALTKAIVAKLVHDPTMALRDAAGTSRADRLVGAVRDLFDLDEDGAAGGDQG